MVLLIEDIVDTGNTLSFLKTELIKNGAKQVECVTLLFKPMKYNYDSLPEYIGFNIGPEFVVGFGMDLNQKGRDLEDIYKNSKFLINDKVQIDNDDKKLFGQINEKTYRAASMIELLHTATLVHDDVIDNSNLRRGFFSINAIWKIK